MKQAGDENEADGPESSGHRITRFKKIGPNRAASLE